MLWDQRKSKSFVFGSTSGNFNRLLILILGGRIDHGHHNNTAKRALHETLAFEDAVKKALELTNSSETLIVVTADHSHVFNIGGNSYRGNNILGKLFFGHKDIIKT